RRHCRDHRIRPSPPTQRRPRPDPQRRPPPRLPRQHRPGITPTHGSVEHVPATDLIIAATEAVYDAFGDAPVFSCLTGSTATDSDTPDSDIDLLVILPNELPAAEAIPRREKFTRNYIRLHTAFDRTPDLQWPGEVCYAADLDAAINGGAF